MKRREQNLDEEALPRFPGLSTQGFDPPGLISAGSRRSPFIEFSFLFAPVAIVLILATGFTLIFSNYAILGGLLAFLSVALALTLHRTFDLIRKQPRQFQARLQALKSGYDAVVSVLSAALDLRDHVTLGHARRVAELASVVAWQMGLRKEQVRQIERAALLHDVGKLAIADHILAKPAPLNEQEWAQMRKHSELGYQILREFEFLQGEAEIVFAHHERFDGTGYPRGLKGSRIALGARIFAVVDAYYAMTSHRPYRKPVAHHAAVEEIVANSGTQFDPRVVNAFLEAEEKGLLQKAEDRDEVEAFFASVTRQSRPDPVLPADPGPTAPLS